MESEEVTKVITNYPEGNITVYIKCHGNPFSCY